MLAQDLITSYLNFFTEKGHTPITAAPMATAPADSTLFVSAGMQPLIPYLAGQSHPNGRRLVDLQPCIRTIDIDEVGDTTHLTFFEMLGNWSLGDYFKGESIAMSYEFLTQHLNIEPKRLWVTVFAGDAYAPADRESPLAWQQVGIPNERIIPLGRADNWWGPVGNTGPCGPDTEIFFDTGLPNCGATCRPGCPCGRFVEIWNNVFMAYQRTADGRDELLPKPCVDTGLGVDRVANILQGHASVFATELFQPIINQLDSLSAQVEPNIQSIRIVADHLKAATMIMSEGTKPSNKGQGYIVRRLIRRAIDHSRRLEIPAGFILEVAQIVTDIYEGRYPNLRQYHTTIIDQLQAEEVAFNRTLQRGRRIFDTQISALKIQAKNHLLGESVFQLFDTYGIPAELTKEWASEEGVTVDLAGFSQALKRHREISGGGKQGEFAGGLTIHNPQTTQLHTATHLLHQALRDILGPHVAQKGSHITPERLRFDFSHSAKLTTSEISQIEALVNAQIKANLAIVWDEIDLTTAKNIGAIGLFEEKYGNQVRVYHIGDYSCEICGGPHVSTTGELGHFRITREQSNGAGVRRIRAVVEGVEQP